MVSLEAVDTIFQHLRDAYDKSKQIDATMRKKTILIQLIWETVIFVSHFIMRIWMKDPYSIPFTLFTHINSGLGAIRANGKEE